MMKILNELNQLKKKQNIIEMYLKDTLKKEKVVVEKIRRKALEEGWIEFNFHPNYYGNDHSQDIDIQFFLFSPSLKDKIEYFKKKMVESPPSFCDSYKNESFIEYNDWVESLNEGDDYIELPQ